jgi:hypothetical protein
MPRRTSSSEKKGSRQGSASTTPRVQPGAPPHQPDELGPKLDSQSVMLHFAAENAGTSPLAGLMREFASRVVMLFDLGADSGANFSDYWTMMLDLRGADLQKELRGLGPLFRFIYQHVYAAERATEKTRLDGFDVTKADAQRAKAAVQVQQALERVQKSVDGLLHSSRGLGSSAGSPQQRASLDSAVHELAAFSNSQLLDAGVPSPAMNALLQKTREAMGSSHSASRSASQRAPGLPPRTPRVAGDGSLVPAPPGAAVVCGAIASVTPRPTALMQQSPLSSPRQPHPSLPAIGSSTKALRPHQQVMELPLRPFASPFAIRAQFDVESWTSEVAQRQRHKAWLKAKVAQDQIASSTADETLAWSHEYGSASGTLSNAATKTSPRNDAPPVKLSRDEQDVMARLRHVREEVLGEESNTVVHVGPRSARRPTASAATAPTEPA